MGIEFGRELCGDLSQAVAREWLVTNGIGGYAAGTVAGVLTRRYHGLLVAALNPPLGRTLLLSKLDETACYQDRDYPLHTNRWVDRNGKTIVSPHGYCHIESFALESTVPTWYFALADALLEKRIWMQQGSNTTYVQYQLKRANQPVELTVNVLINYRDHHSDTQGDNWQTETEILDNGIKITAHPDAKSLYLFNADAKIQTDSTWYYNFDLAMERSRGLVDRENHCHVATLTITLHPGESCTIVASTDPSPNLKGEVALQLRRNHEQKLIHLWQAQHSTNHLPDWIQQLIFAADQCIADRPLPHDPTGKTIIAGYPWFGDWGRDSMISLPGLTLTTGRPEIARSILCTFAQYIDQGMLPNRFPDAGEIPEYNTVDATLWYFEAIRLYHYATEDDDFLKLLFPVLAEIIDWHCRGTRYNIHLDASDGLLYAGENGVQLTWMDAKVEDWVVTPRIGKPIEVNALWYNALRSMGKFARCLNKPYQEYDALAERTLVKFARFWNGETGYCYDVLDGPEGHDAALRPNQIFAVSLPHGGSNGWTHLLNKAQQKSVVDICGQTLLTSYGLRSLSPDHAQYQGHYDGDQRQRDGAYHQGTTWGWLIGPFIHAHLRVYQNPMLTRQFLRPWKHQLSSHGLGTLSEIFDGDAPIAPNGCIAQAWTVAEVLRAWIATEPR
jgi:predicted glycogen debranching enzyme